MYLNIKCLVELQDNARKIQIKQYTKDERLHSAGLNRCFSILTEKGNKITDEDIYDTGKGPIQRFEEFEDEESLGYIVKLKRQPSITFRIYKNSWKMPTVEYSK